MTSASKNGIGFQFGGWEYTAYLNENGFLDVFLESSNHHDTGAAPESDEYEDAVQFAIDEIEPMLKRFVTTGWEYTAYLNDDGFLEVFLES